MRLDGHIASGQARAAGRDDHIHIRIGTPVAQLGRDLVAFVADDLAIRQQVPRPFDPPHQRVARLVLIKPPRIRDGQNRDTHGDKLFAFVDTRHQVRSSEASRRASAVNIPAEA